MAELIDRTGEKRMMKCGMEAEIIAYRSSRDIDVQFSNGVIVSNKDYRRFSKGNLSYRRSKSFRLGEKRMMNCGMKAEIIAYRSSKDIDVQFSNGVISKNKFYSSFIRGEIAPFSVDSHRNLRLGEKRMMNCGMKAIIIAYRSSTDIDVKFDDGSIRFSVTYRDFKRGGIRRVKLGMDSNHRLGERRVMNCGLVAEIIAYRSARDIDVRFDNGFTAYNRYYLDFKHGSINNLNCVSNRVGEKRVMNCGLEVEIVEYRSSIDMDVRFEDGTVVEHRNYYQFQSGTIRHPNFIIGCYKGTLSSFTIEKLAYRLKDARDVFYICECQKCKLRDILTPREMLDHKCEVINNEQ